MEFTCYFCSLIQSFNFRTKIPLRPQKMAIAKPPPLRAMSNGHWSFCVTKVGMVVIPMKMDMEEKIKPKTLVIKVSGKV